VLGVFRRSTKRRDVRGQSVLDIIADAQYPIVTVPFAGAMVPVKLRELTQIQIQSCGDMSLIQTFADKVRQKSSRVRMIDLLQYADRYHKIAELSLVAPTYDQIMRMFDRDRKVADARAQVEELKAKLRDTPNTSERRALEEEIDGLAIWCDLLLPEDFLGAIMSYALGIEKSDIKQVTEDMLLEAAMLAQRGGDNPADHLDGRFSAFMRDDINRRAWVIHNKWVEKHAKDKKGKGLTVNER
jgi:hypothetical protein